ncbi:SAICAR synthetase domain-containing protein [Ditylenchus destructor]|uniref:SAICAR synthetase domain-containing protein n=1 Tax=Ditylenchus destructor TaxID=166010 RepID=A0AAD4N7P3_9BILA|nr:SAICAR synthetase domain-containing protein [Ditylenchus destructor]
MGEKQSETPLARGKTKAIFAMKDNPELVLIESFDSLTAFNAKRKDTVSGKAAAATRTTCNVFQFLSGAGCQTHFVKQAGDCEFVAKRCEMIPIEWVARRIATGSFLKRNPGVEEGYVFPTPKIETFFKDDANDDPQWSEEQILANKFVYCGGKRRIGRSEVDIMKRWTSAIFRLLERAWMVHGCVLVDMKIEFGVDTKGNILLADVVDNDSWRVWPNGDRRLQLDKQFYRDLKDVTDDALVELKKNYDKVAELTSKFTNSSAQSKIVIVMGSSADLEYTKKIETEAKKLGVADVERRICSAHKSTAEVLQLADKYEAQMSASNSASIVFIAVAGRSNGLGGVLSASSTIPVISAPPLSGEWGPHDIWSSIRMPSGVGCTTVFGPDEAALAACKILAQTNHTVFSKILARQTVNVVKILEDDNQLNNNEE